MFLLVHPLPPCVVTSMVSTGFQPYDPTKSGKTEPKSSIVEFVSDSRFFIRHAVSNTMGTGSTLAETTIAMWPRIKVKNTSFAY